MAVSFKGAHFPQEIILMGVRWYVAYPLSYRHVEELMEERGVQTWPRHPLRRWGIAPTREKALRRVGPSPVTPALCCVIHPPLGCREQGSHVGADRRLRATPTPVSRPDAMALRSDPAHRPLADRTPRQPADETDPHPPTVRTLNRPV